MSSNKPAVPVLYAGLAGRCPRCGKGSLFDGYIRIAKGCRVCGLSFEGHDTGDGPAFFIMLPLCLITAGLALVIDLKYMPPMWLHIVLWPTFIALAVGLSLRPVKATMVALQYRHRDVENADPPHLL
tara:strand:+ start:2489 stop:2869 length:381 start_codon:yes stop_codon:yes gene_type:complete